MCIRDSLQDLHTLLGVILNPAGKLAFMGHRDVFTDAARFQRQTQQPKQRGGLGTPAHTFRDAVLKPGDISLNFRNLFLVASLSILPQPDKGKRINLDQADHKARSAGKQAFS